MVFDKVCDCQHLNPGEWFHWVTRGSLRKYRHKTYLYKGTDDKINYSLTQV